MSLVNVAFEDSAETVITAAFAVAQPAETFPYQGVVDTDSSAAWAAFYNALSPSMRGMWPDRPEAAESS